MILALLLPLNIFPKKYLRIFLMEVITEKKYLLKYLQVGRKKLNYL